MDCRVTRRIISKSLNFERFYDTIDARKDLCSSSDSIHTLERDRSKLKMGMTFHADLRINAAVDHLHADGQATIKATFHGDSSRGPDPSRRVLSADMPTASSPRREEHIHKPDDRGFSAFTYGHAFSRNALQVAPILQPSAGQGQNVSPGQRLTPRMGMVAASILTPHVSHAVQPDPPWFRAETPEAHRMPLARQQSMVWSRRLDVGQERSKLSQIHSVVQNTACWPCDIDPASNTETPMMGSLKVFEAQKECVEVRRIVQDEMKGVMLARQHAIEHDTHEVVDTVESLLQIGLSGFEASMEQYERADHRLGRLRQNALARPPEIGFNPDVASAAFINLRQRYYDARSKEMSRLLKLIDVDRSHETFSDGGPFTNRVKKDPLQGLDFAFDVIEEPKSPMRFSVLKYQKEGSETGHDPLLKQTCQRDDVPAVAVNSSTGKKVKVREERRSVPETRLSSEFAGTATLANRERFRNNPLWVDVDAQSRGNTGAGTRICMPAGDANQRAPPSGVFVPASTRSLQPVTSLKLGADRDQGRFMASSPRGWSPKIAQHNNGGPEVEQTWQFMKANHRIAPELQKRHDWQRKSISAKINLNNTV